MFPNRHDNLQGGYILSLLSRMESRKVLVEAITMATARTSSWRVMLVSRVVLDRRGRDKVTE